MIVVQEVTQRETPLITMLKVKNVSSETVKILHKYTTHHHIIIIFTSKKVMIHHLPITLVSRK